jgi:hypothetical protein
MQPKKKKKKGNPDRECGAQHRALLEEWKCLRLFVKHGRKNRRRSVCWLTTAAARWHLNICFRSVAAISEYVNMRHWRTQNLEARPRFGGRRRFQIDGCCDWHKHSRRVRSSLAQCARVGHGLRMDRWRVCSRGTGKPSNVRRLDSTYWWQPERADNEEQRSEIEMILKVGRAGGTENG